MPPELLALFDNPMLQGLIPPETIAKMKAEAAQAAEKDKLRDNVIAGLVKELGVLTDRVNMLEASSNLEKV